jgi:hypothetical protein
VHRLHVAWKSFVVIVATVVATASTSACGAAKTVADPVFSSTTQAVHNAAFYYGGTVDVRTPQPDATMAALATRLGNPGLVVVSAGGSDEGDRTTVTNLRSGGGIPDVYRYVNLYWEPEGGSSDLALPGLGWTFCAGGSTPPVGREVDGTPWYFLNPSSAQARTAVSALLERLKSDGYSGVMIDRGQAATQNASYAAGRKTVEIWYRRSTCHGGTQTFADGFVSWASLARSYGLKVLFNNGTSPFGAPRMRPDPSDRDCRLARWSRCHLLGDLWHSTNFVLNESATHLQDLHWASDYAGNLASETDRKHGHQTVALITSANLGGGRGQTKAHVFYAWSRVKLFNLSVAVNTGEGGCPVDGSTPCNHYGFYPDLTSIGFGAPRARTPSRTACTQPSVVHCVWHRSYADGMDLVNVSPTSKTVTIPLGVPGCRYVTDVYSGRLLSPHCVSSVRLTLPRWSGRPLTYARTRVS